MDWKRLFQQRRRPILILVAILVLALVLEAGVYIGQHLAYRGMGAKPRNYKAMQAELVAVESSLRSRDTELAIQRTRQEVDRKSLELVRKEMAAQKEQIAGLEEALGFYRSLMAPGEIAPGVSLRGLELMAGDQPREYYYRLVVQQEARQNELLKGTLSVVVKGVEDGQPAEYSLTELSETFKEAGTALQFRYFQSIEGRMVLPEGFEPTGVSVKAKTTKPQKVEIGEDYPWQLEERFTHVGK